MKIYIVQKGDTASEIAAKHGVSLSALKNLNTQLSDPEKLKPGMKIKVPTESKPVLRKPKVVKKETVENISTENAQEPDDEETTLEEVSAMQAFSGNTYTYKIPQEPGSLYPYAVGEEGLEATIPMMEDPFPNAIKEKEQTKPSPYYVNPTQGVYPNVNPYTNPYYFPSNVPTYYQNPAYSTPKEASQGGYGLPSGTMPVSSPDGTMYPQNNPQNYGYYGYAPQAYSSGMRENPLGCRAEGSYSGYYPESAYGNNESEGNYNFSNPTSGREMTTPSYTPGVGETQTPNPYAFPQQGWPGETQVAYPQTTQGGAPGSHLYSGPLQEEWQGETPGSYPYTTQQPGYQSEQLGGYPYTGQQSQGYLGEQMGGNPYTVQQPQGWQGELQGGYPYTVQQPPGWQGTSPSPYTTTPHQGTPGGYGTGPTSSTAPKAPDYSLWESYVDYHVPPYQPDFPIKPPKD